MVVYTCFACDIKTAKCYIFNKSCPYEKTEECDYYYSKSEGFPAGFVSYMNIVNMLAQARANKSQQKFNKYILILSSLAIIISVISFIVSLFH